MAEPAYVKRLAEYFEKNLKKGYPSDSLKWALVSQGYSKTLVEQALEIATREIASKAPVLKEKPFITHEIVDEKNHAVEVKKPWWKRIFGI